MVKTLLAFLLCWAITCTAWAEVSKKSGFKIGDTKQSILSETQFQSIHGPEWVKMRGQVITTSRLCVKFSICTLPNAEGRFLRDSVADAGLRSIPDDTTAKNGLDNVTSTATWSSVDITTATDAHNHTYDKATLQQPITAAVGGANGYTIGTWPSTNTSSDTHSHTFNKNLLNSNQIAHDHALSGDTETAPDHVIVNTFIKIN